jgi:hypothetical protein
MFNPDMPLGNVPPDVRATAARIAKMGRIVVQAFIPPELRAEAEKRLFLTAVGEIQQLREARSAASQDQRIRSGR